MTPTKRMAAAVATILAIALPLAAPGPALAVSAQQLLEAIIPRTGAAEGARPARKRMHGETRQAAPRPPVPTPKPPADTGAPPETMPETTPKPEPSPGPAAADGEQPPAAPAEMPLPEPSPAEQPAGPPVDVDAAPPDASGISDDAFVVPSPPFSEPMPPAGTVIRPADALGAVLPPVLPPEPPAEPEPPAAPPSKTAAPETRPPEDAAALAACRAGMAALSITAEPQPPLAEGVCGAPDPFKVTALQSGAVTLAPAATVDCAVASALARWVAEDVQTAARAAFGAPVTAIAIAGSYACRGRDNIEGAKLSEHAFMNAIDISGFTIDGRTVTVTEEPGEKGADARFMKAIRASACLRFTTVLGPGSDVYHADHLHLDMIRRGRNGDAHFCQ